MDNNTSQEEESHQIPSQEIEKETEKDIERKTLQAYLLSCLSNDKMNLFLSLSSLRASSHLYYTQWNHLKDEIPDLLDQIFDLIRKYEINGLQLHGLGCWLFEKIIRDSKYQIQQTKYSEEIILEVILRILFEHPIPTICQEILIEALRQNPSAIYLICKIGRILSLSLSFSVCHSVHSLTYC